MATLQPFRALRPKPSEAAQVAAVPYDVVNTAEARALAGDNPLSFLRVSRAEIELPDGTDPYSPAVYERAAGNFDRLRRSSLLQDDEPRVYLYRLQMGGHVQMGVAGCYLLDEYDRDVIRKHERTRPDKEDDRTRHMLALGAQTGPVFLTYRADPEVDLLAERASAGTPIADFEAPDGVRHTVWRAGAGDAAALAIAFEHIPALYIADGHHRAASAARARRQLQAASKTAVDAAAFLAVAFPHDQVQILPYNRIVKQLNGLTPDSFLEKVRARFDVQEGSAMPAHRGEIAMYVGRHWHTLRPHTAPRASDVIGALDVSLLQDELIAPVLGITDVRTDKRIDFVGGARGTGALERLVDSGDAAAAFSLFPVGVSDLMAVSDAGEIMPPKSTWFEPKLRDGLLIHLI